SHRGAAAHTLQVPPLGSRQRGPRRDCAHSLLSPLATDTLGYVVASGGGSRTARYLRRGVGSRCAGPSFAVACACSRATSPKAPTSDAVRLALDTCPPGCASARKSSSP